MSKKSRIEALCIDYSKNILFAIKQMDLAKSKLLIVTKNENFLSLISIGDIQRAIINQIELSSPIKKIIRDKTKITVAKNEMSTEEVKKLFFVARAEFMPVLDDYGALVDVYFWKDHFKIDIPKNKELREIPVVIMAGGQGTRLKPITNIIPKALLPIDDKPIIEIIKERFESFGVKKFYFMLNYKSEMIVNYFNEKNKGNGIEYILEKIPLGTAGSLNLLSEKINSTFFVSNCDILIDADYNEIYRYHIENKCEITLVSAFKHYAIPYGTIKTTKEGYLKKIEEKPEKTFLINSGLYVLESHLLQDVPKNDFYHITNLIDNIMKRNGKIGVFPISEKSWMDIGEWEEYNRTQKNYKDFFID